LSLFILLQHETLLSRSTQGHSLRFYVQRLQVFLLVEKRKKKNRISINFLFFFGGGEKLFQLEEEKSIFCVATKKKKILNPFRALLGSMLQKCFILHTYIPKMIRGQSYDFRIYNYNASVVVG
jgi:hypothetical protein